MPTSPRGSFKFFISGAEGISSVIRDQRRKGLRIASNTPPALSLSKVGHHRGSGDRICSPTRLLSSPQHRNCFLPESGRPPGTPPVISNNLKFLRDVQTQNCNEAVGSAFRTYRATARGVRLPETPKRIATTSPFPVAHRPTG